MEGQLLLEDESCWKQKSPKSIGWLTWGCAIQSKVTWRLPAAGSRLVQEADEVLAAARLLQLSNRFGFDLADPLASYFEDVPDFL